VFVCNVAARNVRRWQALINTEPERATRTNEPNDSFFCGSNGAKEYDSRPAAKARAPILGERPPNDFGKRLTDKVNAVGIAEGIAKLRVLSYHVHLDMQKQGEKSYSLFIPNYLDVRSGSPRKYVPPF